MEKHIVPLLSALIGIVGQPNHNGAEPDEVNQVYTLLLKILLWGLCLGWAAALGLGIFTANKLNSWMTSQETINKAVSETLISYGAQQRSNVACIEEIKRDLKDHMKMTGAK